MKTNFPTFSLNMTPGCLTVKARFFPFALAFIISSTTFSALAQRKMRIGVETGPTLDRYHISETNSNLRLVSRGFNMMWGVSLNQELNDHISLETGFIRKNNEAHFNFENPDYKGPSGSPIQAASFQSTQFPLRFRFQFPLINNRLWISPSMGYVLCIKRNKESLSYPGVINRGITFESTSIRVTSVADYSDNRVYSLLETGFGIQYRVFKELRLGLNVCYFTGFKTLNRVSGTVTRNSETSEFFATSTDESLNIRLGLSYPIAGF